MNYRNPDEILKENKAKKKKLETALSEIKKLL